MISKKPIIEETSYITIKETSKIKIKTIYSKINEKNELDEKNLSNLF